MPEQGKLFGDDINVPPEDAGGVDWSHLGKESSKDYRTEWYSVEEGDEPHFKSKEAYYKSSQWQRRRVFAIHRAKYCCERCGRKGTLEVHHLNYDNLYNEEPRDLQALCTKCHPKADREREYENAIITYAEKKYGSEYWKYVDDETLEREFERFKMRSDAKRYGEDLPNEYYDY